jgi:hypothetical protein
MTSKQSHANFSGVSVYFYSERYSVSSISECVGIEPSWSIERGDNIRPTSARSNYNAVRFNVDFVEDADVRFDQVLAEALRIIRSLTGLRTPGSSLGLQIRADMFPAGESISIGPRTLGDLSALDASLDVLF